MSAFPNIQEYYKNFEKQEVSTPFPEDQINWKHEFIHLCIYIYSLFIHVK